MPADYTFDPGIVFDDTTLTPAIGATGVLLNVAGGTAQQVYNLNGTPMSNLTTNSKGYVARFKAGITDGVLSFGSVLQPVASIESQRAGLQAAAAQSAASDAAAAATTAAAAAEAARVAAVAAQSAAQAAAGSGGSSGGLPAGTTLEQIPNGATRLAMTVAERNKIAATPTTFLQIGTTSTTAKAGDWVPTASQISAVQTMTGPQRMWVRTAAQGFPTVADGAQDGDILIIDAS